MRFVQFVITSLVVIAGLVGALLLVAFVDEFVRVLAGNKPCYMRDPPKTADEIIERAAESGV